MSRRNKDVVQQNSAVALKVKTAVNARISPVRPDRKNQTPRAAPLSSRAGFAFGKDLKKPPETARSPQPKGRKAHSPLRSKSPLKGDRSYVKSYNSKRPQSPDGSLAAGASTSSVSGASGKVRKVDATVGKHFYDYYAKLLENRYGKTEQPRPAKDTEKRARKAKYLNAGEAGAEKKTAEA